MELGAPPGKVLSGGATLFGGDSSNGTKDWSAADSAQTLRTVSCSIDSGDVGFHVLIHGNAPGQADLNSGVLDEVGIGSNPRIQKHEIRGSHPETRSGLHAVYPSVLADQGKDV